MKIVSLLFISLTLFVNLLYSSKSFAETSIEKKSLENWQSSHIGALNFKIPFSFMTPVISDASTRETATGKIINYAEEVPLYQSFGGKESFDIFFFRDKKIGELKNEISGSGFNKPIVVDKQSGLYREYHSSHIDQYGRSDGKDWILKTVSIQFGKDVYQFDSQTPLSPAEVKNSLFDKILSTFKFTQTTTKSPNIYTVEKGDTLWDIAGKLYGDNFKWTEIAKANNLVNPDLIHPGNVFIIPLMN